MPPYTPKEEQDRKSREETKQKLKAKLARPPKPSPEALAAVKKLDKEQLKELRNKLAGVEPEKFPEGTGQIQRANEDDINFDEAGAEETK